MTVNVQLYMSIATKDMVIVAMGDDDKLKPHV